MAIDDELDAIRSQYPELTYELEAAGSQNRHACGLDQKIEVSVQLEDLVLDNLQSVRREPE